jgi:ribose-phosphate pyrophosphokinase
MNYQHVIDLTKSEGKSRTGEELYKISKFPDGQQDVWINPGIRGIASWVLIKSHFNSWLDLELIACAKASLNEMGINDVHLFIPYFLGARSDRKFAKGGTWYLKDVICPAINNLNFQKVTVVDPHSDVLGNLIKNINIIKNGSYVSTFINSVESRGPGINIPYIVSPDAGAEKKIYDLAQEINYPGEVVCCYKVRDKSGQLVKTIVTKDDFEAKDIFIIDDICDGGRTFIELSKELKKRNAGKIYLIVSHGIFSKGTFILREHFDRVYCTNSISEIESDDGFVVQYDIFNKALVEVK